MDLDLLGLAKQLFDGVMHGQWALAVAAALVLAVYLVRKYLAPKIPFLGTDFGGVLLAFVGSAAGGLLNAFVAGQGFSWALLVSVGQVAFLAMGGWAALKKLLGPLLDKLLIKLGLKAA